MEILLKNYVEINIQIKKTNDDYKNLICLCNNVFKNEILDTFGSLFLLDNETVKTIEINKIEKYIFITNYIYSMDFIKKQKNKKRNKYSGKWMLFGSTENMINWWNIIRTNTFNNNLGYFSKFIGNEKKHVICVYFDDYRDKENIIKFGEKIKELIDYNNAMYFKPSYMTKEKKYGIGSWIYMIKGKEYTFID